MVAKWPWTTTSQGGQFDGCPGGTTGTYEGYVSQKEFGKFTSIGVGREDRDVWCLSQRNYGNLWRICVAGGAHWVLSQRWVLGEGYGGSGGTTGTHELYDVGVWGRMWDFWWWSWRNCPKETVGIHKGFVSQEGEWWFHKELIRQCIRMEQNA